MYFFSGEQDVLVPIASPRRMVESLQKTGLTAEMYPIKNAGHIEALFDRGALEHALSFADKSLKGEGVAAKGTEPKVETRDGE